MLTSNQFIKAFKQAFKDVEYKATSKDGKVIKSEKVIYKKESEFLTAEGNVEFFDTLGNVLKTNKVTYDKINEINVMCGSRRMVEERSFA